MLKTVFFCVSSQVNKSVTSVNLERNGIKDEGVKAVAEMLKVCSRLFWRCRWAAYALLASVS